MSLNNKIKSLLNLKGERIWLFTLLLCVFSFIAGSINGFVGTGGGIIFVYTLLFLTKNEIKNTYATCLCAVVPISLCGLVAYYRAGSIDYEILKAVLLPCALGGLLGAFFNDRLKGKWLNIIFSLLVIYSGISLMGGFRFE